MKTASDEAEGSSSDNDKLGRDEEEQKVKKHGRTRG